MRVQATLREEINQKMIWKQIMLKNYFIPKTAFGLGVGIEQIFERKLFQDLLKQDQSHRMKPIISGLKSGKLIHSFHTGEILGME